MSIFFSDLDPDRWKKGGLGSGSWTLYQEKISGSLYGYSKTGSLFSLKDFQIFYYYLFPEKYWGISNDEYGEREKSTATNCIGNLYPYPQLCFLPTPEHQIIQYPQPTNQQPSVIPPGWPPRPICIHKMSCELGSVFSNIPFFKSPKYSYWI